MKYLLVVIYLCFTSQLVAQENFPRIEKVVVKDALFHGQIDKDPITIYLKYAHHSNYHAGVYSVEGWYYYDKVKTKIPLIGLSENAGLTLYNFTDTAKSNELLHFHVMKNNHWDDMEYYKNISGFQEKFVLENEGHYWTNDNKKLEISLKKNDLTILKVDEYLHLDSNHTFDLQQFGEWTWNFELLANENGKFILHFEHGSRLYAMGQCGAGMEAGFFQLEFDSLYNLIHFDGFLYESCNFNISSEELKNSNGKIWVYNCHDYRNEKSYDLRVDLNKLTLEKKIRN